jgi:aspartate kinase
MCHELPQRLEISVIKLGGSVLTDAPAYRTAADFLKAQLGGSPRRRIVAVVSAQFGHTDALLAEAGAAGGTSDVTSLDLLWSTGELRSVALLTLQLHALGVSAAGLNVHQTGIFVSRDSAADAPPAIAPWHERAEVNPLGLRFALAHHLIVIVPGFLARGPRDAVLSLGRGGSDLTAVLLAEALNATTCELVKDVPGYFDRDPNQFDDAQPLAELSFEEALHLAEGGCDLVQREALLVAQRSGTTLVIRALDESAPRSVVSDSTRLAAQRPKGAERLPVPAARARVASEALRVAEPTLRA